MNLSIQPRRTAITGLTVMFALWLAAIPAFFGHVGASTRAEGLSPAATPVQSAARALVTLPEQLWPKPAISNHPVLPFLHRLVNGDFGPQPAWKLPMLLHALTRKPEDAVITAYCEEDHDGGGSYTRWGTHVRRGICAADARYFGPGSVVWIGDPINESLIVEDTGGAIKGPNRFDVCVSGHHTLCNEIGRRHTSYIVLYRVPPKSNWGDKPSGWEPPVLSLKLAANVSE